MKANISATSVYDFTGKEFNKRMLKEYGEVLEKYGYEDGTIEICSLEQLAKLSEDLGAYLIISSNDNLDLWIEIYDDYRE